MALYKRKISDDGRYVIVQDSAKLGDGTKYTKFADDLNTLTETLLYADSDIGSALTNAMSTEDIEVYKKYVKQLVDWEQDYHLMHRLKGYFKEVRYPNYDYFAKRYENLKIQQKRGASDSAILKATLILAHEFADTLELCNTKNRQMWAEVKREKQLG